VYFSSDYSDYSIDWSDFTLERNTSTESLEQDDGLKSQEIWALPHVKLEKQDVEKELQCAVCLKCFELNIELTQLPCNHMFHSPCIIPWLKRQATCPLCREKVPDSKQIV